MKLTALKYGETILGEDRVFLGGRADVQIPISLILYLIETENRAILVDAGCDTMPGFVLSHFCGPVAVLNRYGLDAADVTDVILTHGHHDHIEGVGHFRHAKLWMQADAYRKRGHSYIPTDADVCLFEKTVTVTEGVRAVCVGGHATGSCIVEIQRGEQNFVISGDECYSRLCLERSIPTGASVCPEKSRAFVEQYGDPRYRVLLSHDGELLAGRNGYQIIFE